MVSKTQDWSGHVARWEEDARRTDVVTALAACSDLADRGEVLAREAAELSELIAQADAERRAGGFSYQHPHRPAVDSVTVDLHGNPAI
jgi:hypothetical protein